MASRLDAIDAINNINGQHVNGQKIVIGFSFKHQYLKKQMNDSQKKPRKRKQTKNDVEITDSNTKSQTSNKHAKSSSSYNDDESRNSKQSKIEPL